MPKKFFRSLVSFGLISLFLMSLFSFTFTNTANAASSTVTASGEQGWVFNPDPATQTPYSMSNSAHSTGLGSLFVAPISSNAPDKFIAANQIQTEVSTLQSIGFDFQIDGSGTTAEANQFYLNLYVNIDSSDNFYDCRFDYVPNTGAVGAFTTTSFAAGDTPVNVVRRSTTRIEACPTTLADMPEGSFVRAIAINVGDDTSTSDTGLAGYLDNVVITTSTDQTNYDFEPVAVVTPPVTPPVIPITPNPSGTGAQNPVTTTTNAPSGTNNTPQPFSTFLANLNDDGTIGATPTPVITDIANGAVLGDEANNNDVLGATNQNAITDGNGFKFFGVTWYWLLIGLGGFGFFLFLAYKRYQTAENQS